MMDTSYFHISNVVVNSLVQSLVGTHFSVSLYLGMDLLRSHGYSIYLQLSKELPSFQRLDLSFLLASQPARAVILCILDNT